MIYLGQDILEEHGIVIYFKTKQITWDEVSITMRSLNTIHLDSYFIKQSVAQLLIEPQEY